eukprot:scaffold2214_cov139-Cylindrotheca_fusiformis.AAC.1
MSEELDKVEQEQDSTVEDMYVEAEPATDPDAFLHKEPDIPMCNQPKLGGKCCFGWYVTCSFAAGYIAWMSLTLCRDLLPSISCDYRRAVVGMCWVSLLCNLPYLAYPSLIDYVTKMLPDDFPELQAILSDAGDTLFIVAIVHIVMTIIAITGACMFNFYLVAIYPFWAIANCVLVVINQAKLIKGVFDWIGDEIEGSGADQEDVEEAFGVDLGTIEDYADYYLYFIMVFSILFTLLWTYPSIFLAIEIKKGIMTQETYPRERSSCCCG